METADLRATVIEIISSETGIPVEGLHDHTLLEEIVEDSLEFLSLITALRAKFGEFPDAWLPHIKTVHNTVEMLEAFVNGVVSGRAI